MKNRQSIHDLQLLQQAFKQLPVPVDAQPSDGFSYAINCYYRCNPDGSIRWIWPVENRYADFLRFYHRSHWKAYAFVAAVKLAFSVQCPDLFSHGRLQLFTTNEGCSILQDIESRWAVFTGTIGPNRKLVFWQQDSAKKSSFTKIAIGTNATANLKAEGEALTRLAKTTFYAIQVPALMDSQSGVLEQEDIASNNVRRTHHIDRLPASALQEWLQQDLQQTPLAEAPFWKQSLSAIQLLKEKSDARIPIRQINHLQQLADGLSTTEVMATTTAHGDFTPWNLFIEGDKLSLIDWELSQPQMPALFDLFHFVYQSNILVSHNGYKQIRRQLDALFQQPEWNAFLHRHQLDARLLEQLYLVHTVSYYLNIYSQQAEWHQQVGWLLQTWSEALCFFINEKKSAPARQLMLGQVADLLANKKYALLKFMSGRLEAVPEDSDVDICIDKRDAATLLKQLKNHPLVAQVKCVHRSYMVQASVVLSDGSLLHLDLIWRIKRKALEFVSANELIGRALYDVAGNKVPCAADNFAYTSMFYVLNGAAVPERYQQYFTHLSAPQQGEINGWIKENFLSINSFASLYNTTASQQQQVLQAIKAKNNNRGWSGLKNRLQYVIDTIRNLAPRKGFIITFSGVDGAGKSTVIENTKRHIEKQLRGKVVVLRHRPSLLPILSAYKYGRQGAEQKAATTLPRQGKNGSVLSSLLRFGYYYSDYVFGQLYIQARYVWRGYIVLYDRYYFDFINDSRRSNISLPKSFTTWGYHLLLKPRLNFFLYAKPEEILQRKQELDAGTIEMLTGHYLQLFTKLGRQYRGSKYVPVHNTNLDQTLQLIYKNIKTSCP